jgi:Ca2+-binding EF-hand superfamily protein
MSKHQFQPHERELILDSFTLYDLDNDGKLSAKVMSPPPRKSLPSCDRC